MAKKPVVYKRKRISVIGVHKRDHLFLDDEYIETNKKKGKFYSQHRPYEQFTDLHELGKAIVDYRALDQERSRKVRKG